jgi:choline dehydrogenase
MRATSQGILRLQDANPETLPSIDPRYVTDPEGHDRAVLECAARLLREMSNVPELARFLGAEIVTTGELSDTVVSYCHPAGTCKMGPESDRSAVVDALCRVHGIQGLYVADASIIPTNVRGNLNLPTAMIAAHAVQTLIG